MYIAIVVVGGSNSYLIKLSEEDKFYWGPSKEDAHRFDTKGEALSKGRNSLNENMADNVRSEKV